MLLIATIIFKLGGCLWEAVAYESLDHISQHFAFLAYGICRDLPMFEMFYLCEKSISRTNPIEKLLSLVLPRNVIMLQHRIVKFRSYYLRSSGCFYMRLKTKENFKLLAQKVGCSHLREVVAYKRQYSDFTSNFVYFGKLAAEKRWSLNRCGHNWRLNSMKSN